MSQHILRLPESLFAEAQAVAQEEQISLNEFFITAIAEKIGALRTERYFRERSAEANEKEFLAVLDKIKKQAGPLEPGDEL